jgi:DNA-binding SARP family transcriptional activator
MPAVARRAPVRLILLGGFALYDGDRPVSVPVSAQRVLALLALHDRPLQRVYVAGCLWLESTQERANASLRTALWRLRQLSCRVIQSTTTELSLGGDVTVDVNQTTATAHRALAHVADEADLETLCQAGEILPGWYDEWLLIDRERFRQLRVHALESLSEDCVRQRRFAAATAAALAAVSADPLRESAHRAVIGAHLAEDNFAEALQQYFVYRKLIH